MRNRLETMIDEKTCLLIIDVQNFYFPGGKWELENPREAAANICDILDAVRNKGQLVVHVCHNSEPGIEIHETVRPLEDEKVIIKDEVNCFKNTDLLEYLNTKNIRRLLICGMMTHMCVEAAARAGHDLGFECYVIHDACTTRTVIFEDYIVNAIDAHHATLGTLSGNYAKIIDTNSLI